MQALPQNLDFDIVRKGAVVGQHRITFRRDGDRIVVHSELAIRVKLLFVTIYRYVQTRQETWLNGKLIGLASTTNDDGIHYRITGVAGPDGIKVTSGEGSWTLPPESLPASYWNVSMVSATGPLVDPTTGKVLKGNFLKVGQDTVTAGGHEILATHYKFEADHRPHDVWYDAGGRWVKMRTVGRDGSLAEWVLK